MPDVNCYDDRIEITSELSPGKYIIRARDSGGFLNPPVHLWLSGATVVVVPFGFEASVSYGQGTRSGPEAIITASHQVEFFDREFRCEPYTTMGLATLEYVPLTTYGAEKSLNLLSGLITGLLRAKKFPVILGGEHSILAGSARGVREAIGPFHLLHFDAHTDLREEYEGNPLSHASAVKRALPYVDRILSIGIRSTSLEEQDTISELEKAGRLKILDPGFVQRYEGDARAAVILDELQGIADRPVYLSFDVDVFDPSVIGSSTGTPEPGGLGWNDVRDVLRLAARWLNIIGAEFVEHAPVQGQHAPDYAIAKLIYQFLSWQFCFRSGSRVR